MASITGATAIVMFTVPGLFDLPQQLQGFAADDVFGTDPIESVETLMGVDGKLSMGFVYVPIRQQYSLQADSPSVAFFDTWWLAMQQLRDVLPANALVTLPALGKKWTMINGGLTNYKPMGDAKKLVGPQQFAVTWERLVPAPI